MRTRTGFLAVVGAFGSRLTLVQPATHHVIRGVITCPDVPTDHGTSTTTIVCLPNGAQVDVADSVPYWQAAKGGLYANQGHPPGKGD
jgi:hypothetical protein